MKQQTGRTQTQTQSQSDAVKVFIKQMIKTKFTGRQQVTGRRSNPEIKQSSGQAGGQRLKDSGVWKWRKTGHEGAGV